MTVKELKDYKNNLFSSLSRNLSEFEKNFILITGAILAFSITFIKEIVKIETAEFIWSLFFSWFLIIVSISVMMFAYLKSSISSDALWKIVDDFLINNDLFKDEDTLTIEQFKKVKLDVNDTFYKSKKKLKFYRFFSLITFIFGVLFLSFFVSINLIKENNTTHKNNYINYLKNDTIKINNNNNTFLIIKEYEQNKK